MLGVPFGPQEVLDVFFVDVFAEDCGRALEDVHVLCDRSLHEDVPEAQLGSHAILISVMEHAHQCTPGEAIHLDELCDVLHGFDDLVVRTRLHG